MNTGLGPTYRAKLRVGVLAICMLFSLSACHLFKPVKEPGTGVGPKIVVDMAGSRPLSPLIFGFGTYMHESREQAEVWTQRPTLYRWGGNSAERYNWRLDATNAGNDYFYLNHGFGGPGNIVDAFIAENKHHGAASAVVLPLLGWVAKDQSSASYPKRLFPDQEQFEANGKAIGNGFSKEKKALSASPEQTSVRAGPAFIAAWVNHLKSEFGDHPHLYIMGNEPMLWGETHRDVHPKPTTYDEYLEVYLSAAVAVRRADPAAVIIGPGDWGWLAVFKSQYDLGKNAGGVKDKDRQAHGGKPFLEWFLTAVKKREDELHVSLLDVLDMHYYPSDLDLYKDEPFNPERARERLAATRSLWDRKHKETGWINEETYFIPLLKSIIARTKPSLKLGIGEYSFKGEQDIGGAIALAEVLRIFIDQNIYMAEYWTEPPARSPAAAAFRLYRNYDGKGHAFGETYVATTSSNTGDLTVVAAKADEHRLTVVMLNKSVTEHQRATLAIDHLRPYVKKVTAYKLGSKNPGELEVEAMPAAREQEMVLPPLSARLIEFIW